MKSASNDAPSPMHAGQAPKGLLNEKIPGTGFGSEIPQVGHAKCTLYIYSSPSITAAITIPSPSFNAVSTESVSLCVIPSFIKIRSTTTSIVCFLFFSRFISSSKI